MVVSPYLFDFTLGYYELLMFTNQPVYDVYGFV